MLILFAVAIVLSASMLFLVQPMAGKMLLPLAGGSPAVWNTCMVFFQAALLGGYLYSHLLTTRLNLKAQVGVHAGVAAVAALLLPMAVAGDASPPSETLALTGWLIGALAVAVGGPFFVVSTTGPLLQRWFSATDHPRAKDPYFLYAASNIGSAVGLLGYPFLLEPSLDLPGQSKVWAIGFLALIAVLIACGVAALRSGGTREESPGSAPRSSPALAERPVTAGRRLLWVALAAVPSSLLIGVTQVISTDIAAIPLLWVIPLFLYLMTFTVAFSPRITIPTRALALVLLPIAAVQVFLIGTGRHAPMAPVVGVHLAGFVVAALMCHRRLADDRPGPERLTEFYFFIALGGVFGGLFNALVAPNLFTTLTEFPIAVGAAIALCPAWRRSAGAGGDRPGVGVWGTIARVLTPRTIPGVAASVVIWGAVGAAIVTGVDWAAVSLGFFEVDIGNLRMFAAILAAAGALALAPRSLAFALILTGAAVAGQRYAKDSLRHESLHLERSFFGIHHVVRTVPRAAGGALPEQAAYSLYHGTTNHGTQIRGVERGVTVDGRFVIRRADDVPRSYYHPLGPVGEAFRHLRLAPDPRELADVGLALTVGTELAVAGAGRWTPGGPVASAVALRTGGVLADALVEEASGTIARRRLAVVGLGAGSIAAYAQPGQTIDFYEIDPEVVRIAEDPEFFTYLAEARARGVTVNIILGDGRRALAQAPDGAYRAILLDAFSSDSIPVHLLTREAVAMYVSKLQPGGVLMVHTSNRYFRLGGVLKNIADDLGLTVLGRDSRSSDDPRDRGVTRHLSGSELMTPSNWALIARPGTNLGTMPADPYWQPLMKVPGMPLWTDSYSSLRGVFMGWME
ncbi:MAG: fused MFS/spermidine synthase [Phycisphaeraceae bacterium]|nr:MAG: fused MFS/spermidine synthase [Phycisphaeraceae bacterium]